MGFGERLYAWTDVKVGITRTILQSTIAPEGTHKTSSTVPESSEEAVLLYDYVGKGTVDLRSTVVPAVFRGQGVGTLLAQAALNFVVEEDLKAHISCWFIKKYLEKHPLPQYEERIVN
ncbi:protein NATD1-like [Heptranchias perlo]|uniref:protein NATD1-like n=1 Tax=Heptranchias perlo TaxID=212740 RepID=UPI00355A1C85